MSVFGAVSHQRAAASSMLQFYQPVTTDGFATRSWDQAWKILIYDAHCSDILSPILNVKQLREHGVTLHLPLFSKREVIADVPAIYFVQPTEECIKRICEDVSAGLYSSFHLNFVSPLPRSLLEALAQGTVSTNSVSLIGSVYDQPLDFVSLEEQLFSLNQGSSFKAFYDQRMSDAQAQESIERVAESLLSFVLTMGVVPVIQAPPDGVADFVAKRLDEKLCEHIQKRGFAFANASLGRFGEDGKSGAGAGVGKGYRVDDAERPVLVLLDRTVDMAVMFHHTWTYQALIHDLLPYKNNRVSVPKTDGSSGPAGGQDVYDLDDEDEFWALHAGSPYPTVVLESRSMIDEYKAAMEKVNLLKDGDSDLGVTDHMLLDKTQDLHSLVNDIPALRKKKKSIDMHSNISFALNDLIKERELDRYFQLEDMLLTSRASCSSKTVQEVMNLISEAGRGTLEDKLRLGLLFLLTSAQKGGKEVLDRLERVCKGAGLDMEPFMYLKSFMSSGLNTGFDSSTTRGGETLGKSGLQQPLASVFAKVSDGVQWVLPQTKRLPATKIVAEIMDNKAGKPREKYRYYDPKFRAACGGTVARETPRLENPFGQAIVFMIGGGNYVEYQNVMDYAVSKKREIIYGCTELLTSTQLLQQVKEIAQ